VRHASTIILMLLLSGCAQQQPVRVDTPRTEGPDKNYSVDLPLGWMKQQLTDKTMLASRDGPLLEAIYIGRRTAKEAFPRIKKGAADNMLASELAELEIAEVKSQDTFTAALTVLENEPALVSSRDAFRIKVSYKNTRGLEIDRVIYGFMDASSYYSIQYIAPKLYYFDRYYPDFEKSVASFQVVKK